MKPFICSLILVGTLILGGFSAEGQVIPATTLEAKVKDQTKKLEKKKIKSPKYGKGDYEIFENSFEAELKNSDLTAPISGIKLRLIPFYIPNDFVKERIGYETGKVQTKDNVSLAANETKQIQFEVEKFEKGESVRDNGGSITIYHLGNEYAGVVMEVYKDGALIATRFDGPNGIRKAYEAWLAKSENAPQKMPVGTIETEGK